MKIPICVYCKLPLKVQGKYARFRCMCDEEIRYINIENICYNSLIECVDIYPYNKNIEKWSRLFIKDFLTISENLVT